MKKNLFKNIIASCAIAIVFVGALQSCNKEIPGATPITTTQNTVTINGFLTTDTTFSFFNAAVIKAGLTPLLSDSNSSFTVFAPNNATFKLFAIAASGGAVTAASSNATVIGFINSLPATTIIPLISYLIIPGREFVFTDIPTTFPNIQLPSAFSLPGGFLPGTTIPIKLSVFPSRRGANFWLNATPVTSFDNHYRNGVVHIIAGIPTPPSATLKTLINADPNLTYFSAAVIRGDSGQVGTNRIDSLLNYAVTNMTVFVPNDNAFKAVLFAQIYASLVAQGVPTATATAQATALSSTPAVFSNPALYGTLTAKVVQGIVVYHFLATLSGGIYQPNIRAFSVNFNSTATSYTTLVNNALAVHPGVSVRSFFGASGLTVDSIKVTGFANGGVPATSKPATNFDKHAVNGVYHIIDGVLLPQ